MSVPVSLLAAGTPLFDAVLRFDDAGRWSLAPDYAVGLTLAVLAVCVATLAATRVSPDVVLMGGLIVLAAARVVPVGEALSGFANAGLATVAVLFVVAEGLRQTGAVDFVGRRLLGTPGSRASAVARVAVPSAVLSAFLNNTAVVATALPVVGDWARKHRISPSHLLMPLSFATVLGGMCTLVGTSTLLVLDGEWKRWADGRDVPGPDGLGLFEIGYVGVPAAAVGLVLLVLFSGRLLPARKPALEQLDDPREYTVEMLVVPGGPVAGLTIEQAGLRHLPNAYLLEIDRDGTQLPAVGPNERLRAGDRLVFVGVVDSVKELRRIPGLTPATDQTFKLDGGRFRTLVEAVVSDGYPFLGQTIRESRFRSHYNAAVIAVARGGERVTGKVGDIRLRAGDTLLLEAPPGFVKLRRYSRHFFLVSQVEDSTAPRHGRAWIARLALAAMVLAFATEVAEPFVAAAVAAGVMMLTRCVRVSEARRAVDWSVLIAIAAGLGLGRAMETSGTADRFAGWLDAAAGGDPMYALAGVFLLTALLANLITAKAAATLCFFIAVSAAERLGANPLAFTVAVMAASAGTFATPVGFQTNLMVLGPGGYRTSDYLRLGLPLTAVVFAVSMAVIPAVWGLRVP